MNQDQNSPEILIRRMEHHDNAVVADIIRTVMTEFQAVGQGYSINDPEVDDMYTAYAIPDAAFYVVENQGRVLGCGGFAPLSGGDKDTCELRKMYFLPELRGSGTGMQLMQLCLDEAGKAVFSVVILKPWKT